MSEVGTIDSDLYVTKKALPVKQRGEFDLRRCLNCGRRLPQKTGPGRPRRTCGDRCRKSLQRHGPDTAVTSHESQ